MTTITSFGAFWFFVAMAIAIVAGNMLSVWLDKAMYSTAE